MSTFCNFDHEEHNARMSKHKKVHKIGEPRKARNRNHAEVNPTELHELEHPGQGAAATNGNDSVLAIGGRELKVTAQNVGSAVKREVEQLRHDLGQLASAGSVLKNARSAREFASITIDVSEKIGNRIVQFEEKMAEVTSGTPLAPLLRMQAGLRKKVVEGSSRLARSVWRIESAPHGEQA
jgi:hypothetical protein